MNGSRAIALIGLLLFMATSSFAQSKQSLEDLLQRSSWDVPIFASHFDEVTVTLKQYDKKTTDWVPTAIRFLRGGKMQYVLIDKTKRCRVGYLFLDNDSCFYSIKGDTLQMTIKGEYLGGEQISFKRDFLVDHKNQKELKLFCIGEYYGAMCLADRARLESYAEAPPHPSIKKH